MSTSPVGERSLTPEQVEQWRRNIRDATLANYQYEMGVATERSGETDAALAYYERVLKILPKHPETHVRLAALLDRLGRGDDAAAARRRALAAEPEFELKGCCAIAAAALAQGDMDVAEPMLERAREIAPGHAAVSALTSLSSKAGFGSDAQEPLPDWAQDIVRDACEAVLGRTSLAAGPAAVLALAERGATWFADSPHIWRHLGEARLAVGDQAGAIAAYERCAAAAPDDAGNLTRYGFLLQLAGDIAGSADVLQRALAAPGGPSVFGLYTHLSNALFGLLKLREVDALLRGAPEDVRNTPELSGLRGILALVQGEAKNAVALLRSALNGIPGNVWIMTQLSLALLKAGDPDAAIAMARMATRQAGEPAGTSTFEGLGLQALGRFDEALQIHQRAVAAQPRNGWALTDLGLALQALGRTDEALEAHRSAIAVTCGDWLPFLALKRPPWAQERLKWAYRELGRPFPEIGSCG